MDLYEIRNRLNSGNSIYDIEMNVTFYARVSTEKDEQLHSLQAQIGYYQEFIQKNPNWKFVDGYIDEGLSATSVTKRESFLAMIEDARIGKFDFIITKEISRFSRNTIDSIKYTQELLSHGVGVLFQSDNINTLMPDSELRLTIMSSIAQDEVRKISERVKFGFRRAIEKGVVLGNNKIWGYTKENGRLIIVEKEAEIIETIFDMYVNQHIGMRTISKILGEKGVKNSKGNDIAPSTIRNIISNPKYKGYYCGNKTQKYDYRRNARKYIEQEDWVTYKDEENVPPIVSEELWDRANIILNKRGTALRESAPTGAYNNRYRYSGKIICMQHNMSYHHKIYRYKSGDKEAWQCKVYSDRGKAACQSPTIYTSELNIIMQEICKEIALNKTDIIHDLVKMYTGISGNSSIEQDIAKIKILSSDIMKKKDKLLDLSLKEKITDDEFEIRNNAFNEDIKKLSTKTEALEQDKIRNSDMFQTVDTLRKLISDELNFDDDVSDGMIETLLDRIEVYTTEEKNVVRLKICMKFIDEKTEFLITRGRGKKHPFVFCHTFNKGQYRNGNCTYSRQ